MSSRTIKVEGLARVEGEGSLHLKVRGERVEEARLEIFEPPRFFEAFLRGRDFREAPDITARICGICPVAYLMSACHAMEGICGVTVDGPLRTLRRLLYCGEWIESHVLHMFLLHVPDFLGYPDSIALAQDHPEVVQRALRLKKTGNALMRLLGGREIHPINVRVGGFYKVPRRQELLEQVPDLQWALEAAVDSARFLAGLSFPDFHQDYEFMALVHPDEYPFNQGRLVTSTGLDLPVCDYDRLLTEIHLPHSTALHSRMGEGHGPAHLGPLARYALNRDKLTPRARRLADELGLGERVDNPFKSVLVRAVEVVFACEEALNIIDGYQMPLQPFLECNPRAGTGYGATEAPRGICYHRYTIDDDGSIQDAKIVAPTSVNQQIIEADLMGVAQANLHLADDDLKLLCERTIRNYDPCISCSTHFLRLSVERE